MTDDDDDDGYLVTSFRKDKKLQYCASRFPQVAINDQHHSHYDIYQECTRDLRTFGTFTRPRVVIPYRRFGTTFRSHLRGGPIIRPETSVRNYHSRLRKTPEECRSHLSLGGSLKSHKDIPVCTVSSNRIL